MIRYDPTLVDLTSNIFVLCTNMKVYYTCFCVRKIGYINLYQSQSVVRVSVHPSVTFLVIVSSPKPLDIATSNFVDA